MSYSSNTDGRQSTTSRLSTWIHDVQLEGVPHKVQTRAKYLILDGLACALVGARLPWSEKAVEGVVEMEVEDTGEGCTIWGWEKRVGPLPATLLNSTFIQGFELDDYHSEAPLHSNAILLPALIAAAEHERNHRQRQRRGNSRTTRPCPTGSDLLLAAIVGYEVGPRVGLALGGTKMLNLGWHSGTVFGPAASSAAVSKLICSSADQIEDAIGIACTQACGLMSAQFESMVKRMQHGFAARNGLFAALMARSGYTGIRSVMERPWGGFLSTFSHGLPAPDMAKDETMELSKYSEGEILKDLSQVWQVDQVAIKPYASMAATHGTIDCIRNLQKRFPERLDAEKSGVVQVVNGITSILIEMSAPAFKRGGWTPDRPVAVTGAQMNSTIVAAMQVVDGRVLLPSQFRPDQLNRDLIWTLVMKTKCAVDPNFVDDPQHRWRQRVTVHFDNGEVVSAFREKPAGVDPALSNEGILTKWRNLTNDLMDVERRDMIERLVLGLETVENAADLGDALGRTRLRL